MKEVVKQVLDSGNNFNFPNILWAVSQALNIPVSDEFAKNVVDCIMEIRWNVKKI